MELFRAAGPAHHRAYAHTNGEDPEWPLWYAEHLHASLTGVLGPRFTRSDLVHDLVAVDRERAARAPQADWPHYYADWFLARYGAAEG